MIRNKIFIYTILLGYILFCGNKVRILASDFSSSNFIVKDPIISDGGTTASSSSFQVGPSISVPAPGLSTSTNFKLMSGFQYYISASSNVLSASTGNSQATLTWTVPTTYNGTPVFSYELGMGTTSGSYSYSTVGNVTTYIKTGLSNGSTYYFKVRAKTAGGIIIAYSNETSITPSSTSTNNASGGGGTTQLTSPNYNFSGRTFPFAQITLLSNGNMVMQAQADNLGYFNFSFSNTSFSSGFSIYATDAQGRRTSTLALPTSRLIGADFKNLILSPTLSSNKIGIRPQEELTLSGHGIPGGIIMLTIPGLQFSAEAIVDTQGSFKFTWAPINITPGRYNFLAKELIFDLTSPESLPWMFKVGDISIPTPPSYCSSVADFNQDCKVNLFDLSILLYWIGKPNPPANIDLNNDNEINLTDFSIMAFYWTGY